MAATHPVTPRPIIRLGTRPRDGGTGAFDIYGPLRVALYDTNLRSKPFVLPFLSLPQLQLLQHNGRLPRHSFSIRANHSSGARKSITGYPSHYLFPSVAVTHDT